MTTERLFEFLVLSQTLNYSKAAKKLFITQSALSRHIMELEKELGVRVLDRDTHGVKLTTEGRILASRASRLISKAQSAVNRLRVAGAEARGLVRIAYLESAINDQLMVFFSSFANKFPEIDFKLDVLTFTHPQDAINDYDITFSMFELPKLPENVDMQLALRSSCVLKFLADRRLSKKHRISLSELTGETLLVPYADDMLSSYGTIAQFVDRVTEHKVNIMKLPSVESALTMADLGKGVTIVPRGLPHTTLANVLSLEITDPECVFDTYVYWNHAQPNSAARIMMDELRSFLTASGNGA